MKKINNGGLFIVLEGGEGCGKTTLADKLVNYYENKGFNIIYTREPGGEDNAEKIRDIAVNGNCDGMTSLLLFSAARNLNLNNTIRPALEKGYIVICDRFALSTLVYQTTMGVKEKDIQSINNIVTKSTLPDLEIVLDVEAKTGLDRVFSNNREVTELDKKGIDFHTQINDKYRTMQSACLQHNIINANKNPNTVFISAIKIIDEYIEYLNSKGYIEEDGE